jgi:hypothetical protein
MWHTFAQKLIINAITSTSFEAFAITMQIRIVLRRLWLWLWVCFVCV